VLSCLDENAVVGYLVRQLSGDALRSAEEHLERCAECRQLVRDAAEGEPPRAPSPEPGPEGERSLADHGRYVLLRPLGAGGFGVVYAAYDSRLDRKIALKLLRSDRAFGHQEVRDRFMREAQAMARLSSPHVVTIYDVTTLDDRIAIAMECIDGTNLRDWLAAERRGFREIAAVFAKAGRGLAAAHEAGLVHRDFKPANVLLGSDGRVAVSDFGLARLAAASPDELCAAEASEAPPQLLDVTLTATGAVLGTPAYMSPEQHRGEPVSAQSDQFSFCVALFEALFGEHPFEGRDAAELAASVRAGKRRASKKGVAPEWLGRAVSRGLSVDPARRHPSMDALVAALSPERRSRSLRVAIVVAVLAGIGIFTGARIHERANLCNGAARVDEIWSAPKREALHRAFLASGAAFAEEAWAFADRGISGYLAQWSLAYRDTCAATRIRGEQSEEALDVRMVCLSHAYAEVRALLHAYASADAPMVASAVHAVTSLSDLTACEDTAGLLSRVPPPRSQRAEIEEARAMLAEAKGARATGQRERFATLTQSALSLARELRHAPLLAETLLVAGTGDVMRGDLGSAEATLHQAVIAAGKGRDDRVAAEAWIELVHLAASARPRVDAGLPLRTGALAVIQRLGGNKGLEAKLASGTGLLFAKNGRYDDALEQHREALRLLAEAYGVDAPQIGPEHYRAAELLWELGRHEEARQFAERSVEEIARTFGPHHPTLALPQTILARHACARGAYEACEAGIALAMASRATPSTPPDHPTFLPMRMVRAEALAGRGRFAEALATLDRAQRIASGFGSKDPWSGIISRAMGEVLLREGALPSAREKAEEAVALLIDAEGEDHPDVAVARDTLGRTLLALGHPVDARAEFTAALLAREERFGLESPLAVSSLVGIGRCELSRGRLEEAEGALARALRLAEGGIGPEAAQARLLLEQARAARVQP
jgi:tetratricopeptide (TPR) repeat protein/predicted Ser/Thr protein kinase